MLYYIILYYIISYLYIYSNNRKHNLAGWTGTALDVSLGSGISGLSPCTGTGGTQAAAEIGSRQGCVT